MRRSAVVTLATFLALAALEASAQAERDELFDQLDRDGDGRLTSAEVTSENRRLFDRLVRLADADEDGSLTAEEFAEGLTPQTPAKPIEEKNDTEHRGADAMRVLLLKLDTNRDTRLTRGEAPEDLLAAFDRLVENADRNKDGELDRVELSRGGPRLARGAEQMTRRLGIDVASELQGLEREQGADADRFDRAFNPREALANPREAAALFQQLDADGDGRLRVAELPEPLQERLGRLLQRADLDGDGGVSKREFLSQAERLSRFLKARGGSAEGAAAMKSENLPTDSPATAADPSGKGPSELAHRLVRRLVKRLDKNGDGVVHRDEAQGKAAQRFAQADANQNGRLDEAELDALARQMENRLRNADRRAKRKSQ